MRKAIFTIWMMLSLQWGHAQVHEFGFWGGGNNIIGDIGSEDYIMPDGWFGAAYYRLNLNPWYSFRLQGMFSQWHVSDMYARSRGRRMRGWEAHADFVDMNFLIEYNFLPLNPYKKPLKILTTPYLMAGVGFYGSFVHSGPVYLTENTFELPFGFGLKFSLTKRIKFNWEVLIHYSIKDDLDASHVRDSFSVPKTNMWSNDWYITQGIGFSFGYGELPCYLNVF
jgi:hypothetical protein